jgi:hypothetical protein
MRSLEDRGSGTWAVMLGDSFWPALRRPPGREQPWPTGEFCRASLPPGAPDQYGSCRRQRGAGDCGRRRRRSGGGAVAPRTSCGTADSRSGSVSRFVRAAVQPVPAATQVAGRGHLGAGDQGGTASGTGPRPGSGNGIIDARREIELGGDVPTGCSVSQYRRFFRRSVNGCWFHGFRLASGVAPRCRRHRVTVTDSPPAAFSPTVASRLGTMLGAHEQQIPAPPPAASPARDLAGGAGRAVTEERVAARAQCEQLGLVPVLGGRRCARFSWARIRKGWQTSRASRSCH